MRKLTIAFHSVLLIAMTGAFSAQAYDGTVYIDGVINDTTCTVSPQSENFTVAMGKVSSKQFSKAGDGAGYEPFSIELEKCGGAASGVTVHFEGTADSKNKDLLSLEVGGNSATGMGIGIYNQDKSFIPYSKESIKFELTPNQPSATLNLYARYIANGDNVLPGTANASATFILTYA